MRPHVVSWTLTNGPVPAGLCVLHVCDVRLCVRPDHLFIGTRPENSADMVAKDRSIFGNRNPLAKLSDATVRHVFERVAAGEKIHAIASELCFDVSSLYKLIRGKGGWRRTIEALSAELIQAAKDSIHPPPVLTHEGTTKHIGMWAQDIGGSAALIRERLSSGWSIARAVTTPAGKYPRRRLEPSD